MGSKQMQQVSMLTNSTVDLFRHHVTRFCVIGQQVAQSKEVLVDSVAKWPSDDCFRHAAYRDAHATEEFCAKNPESTLNAEL
jgi:hypothetical protein